MSPSTLCSPQHFGLRGIDFTQYGCAAEEESILLPRAQNALRSGKACVTNIQPQGAVAIGSGGRLVYAGCDFALPDAGPLGAR